MMTRPQCHAMVGPLNRRGLVQKYDYGPTEMLIGYFITKAGLRALGKL